MGSRLAVVLVVVGLFFAASALAQPYTLNAGHGAMTEHPTHFGLLRLAEIVEERSDGQLIIEVFPDRQLGEEREMVEGLQLGTVDMTVVSTGPLGGFVPEINVVDLPFLFNDSVHAYGVLDGPIGDELLARFADVGIIGAAFWENGWRHLTTNRQVDGPDDLAGLNIRTMENQVHMDSFRALGTSPTPMVWGEVYTSLEQGIIEAQENPITVIYTNNLWEVQDYTYLTGHFYGPHVALISEQTLQQLPDDLQQLLIDATREVAAYQRAVSAQLEAEQIESLREQGMEIVEVDPTPFREAAMDVYGEYGEEFGQDLIDRILSAAGQ